MDWPLSATEPVTANKLHTVAPGFPMLDHNVFRSAGPATAAVLDGLVNCNVTLVAAYVVQKACQAASLKMVHSET